MAKSRKNYLAQMPADAKIKDFLDMVSPSVIQFNVDHYLCGNTYRCVWALREYPTATDEQAILRHLGEKDGITLRIYTRQVTPAEEKRIIHNAANKHRMSRSSTDDLQQTVTAESNLQDVVTLVSAMHRNREPLLHCAVYLELTAQSYDQLKLLQTEVLTELVRSKLNVDRLMLRQQQGFVSVMPSGHNAFGSQFERVLPASSVANLYPFNYSGKTDPQGFYIGKDKYGANVIVDFDKRDDDKTSANILILGNSGQGKSYLMKLLLLNLLEAGKSAISLDVEHEQKDMCEAVGGCFLDLMSGQYRINPLEPKCWDDGGSPEDLDAPAAFRQSTRLSQHISFLRDFFRSYKSFTDRQIDVIEIMMGRLYERWGISDSTDFSRLSPEDYPILSDLYALIEQEYRNFDEGKYQLYTAAILQEILLGLHSMCKGAESKFFNGHTNVTSSRFVVFGVKGLLQASKNVRSAMLFNVLSYLSDKLLTEGNTVAALDELYIWLSDNKSLMRCEEGVEHCVLFLGEGSQDGVLVNSEGYDWARYAAFIPGARMIANSHLEQGISLRNLVTLGLPDHDVYLVHQTADVGFIPAADLAALTDQGKAQFAPLLDARVASIKQGAYGVEVALTGIEPELLTCYDQAVADSQRSTHALEYFM